MKAMPEYDARPRTPFEEFVHLVERRTTVPYPTLQLIVSELRAREAWWQRWSPKGDLTAKNEKLRREVVKLKSRIKRLEKEIAKHE